MTNNDQFSPRELDVIHLLMQGKSNNEIALALGIANRTVEAHLSSIYRKINVTSRTEALIRLSEIYSRESAKNDGSLLKGNPQLKTGGKRNILLLRKQYYVSRKGKKEMKIVFRIVVLLLLVILLVWLIIAVFAFLYQSNLSVNLFS